MQIDRRLLDATHDAFLKWLDDDGEKFTSFWTCRRLREEEVLYKRRTHESARDALHLRDWSRLQPGEGKILARLQEAMRRDENLLQRVIERGWTESTAVAAFFHPGERLPEVERLVWELFEADVADPGGEFDALCDYLRSVTGFGCQWAPMGYLLFLLDDTRQHFMPVHFGQFQKLLRFYGIDKAFSRDPSWERYRLLLDMAGEVRDYLVSIDRTPDDVIDLHSYLYVVSSPECLPIAETVMHQPPRPRPYEKELKRRQKDALQRERIGMEGEKLVLEHEREKLAGIPYADLVEPVGWESNEYGYDVISYEPDGREIHIEIKATSRSEEWATQFHLSAHEAEVAAAEREQWRLYRVTDVLRNPRMHCMGNVVTDAPGGWSRSVSGYCYSRDG